MPEMSKEDVLALYPELEQFSSLPDPVRVPFIFDVGHEIIAIADDPYDSERSVIQRGKIERRVFSGEVDPNGFDFTVRYFTDKFGMAFHRSESKSMETFPVGPNKDLPQIMWVFSDEESALNHITSKQEKLTEQFNAAICRLKRAGTELIPAPEPQNV